MNSEYPSPWFFKGLIVWTCLCGEPMELPITDGPWYGARSTGTQCPKCQEHFGFQGVLTVIPDAAIRRFEEQVAARKEALHANSESDKQ